MNFSGQSYISHIIKLLTATAQSNKVTPLEINELEDKLNDCKTLYTDGEDDYSTVALSSNPSSFSSNESAEEYFSIQPDPNQFIPISVLGSGSFGTVFLSEYKSTYYAIKKLPKNKIHEDQMPQIMAERNILLKLKDPFILRLHGTYQTPNELCFVTEVLEHGDLYCAIYDGNKLKHAECVFYAAGIIMGLEFLHSKKIVYRDLKPENIMIGTNGYPKIIDFGMAKQIPYIKTTEDGTERTYTKCHTLCGTPEYIAPEVILGKGYNSSADVWSLGVIIYEMIYKRTPFVDPGQKKDVVTNLFTNIVLCGKNGIDISKKIDGRTDGTSNARDLLTRIFSGEPNERLCGETPSSLFEHPYFLSSHITKEKIYNQELEAPILQPQFIGSDMETANPVDNYIGDQTIFKDFTFSWQF